MVALVAPPWLGDCGGGGGGCRRVSSAQLPAQASASWPFQARRGCRPGAPDPGDTKVPIRVCALLAVADAQQPAKSGQSSRGAGAPAVPERLLLRTFTAALLADPREFLPWGLSAFSPLLP